MLALCANDNRLQIYEGCNNPDFASWRLAHVLEEHDLVISGISWSPVTNKIVTCSHDRNAFVWSYDAVQVWSGGRTTAAVPVVRRRGGGRGGAGWREILLLDYRFDLSVPSSAAYHLLCGQRHIS